MRDGSLVPTGAEPRAVGRGGGPQPRSRPEELHLNQVLLMLRRRRLAILACVLVALGIGAYYTSRAERIYEAKASIRFEQKAVSITDGYVAQADAQQLGTEMEVLRSRSLAQDAAKVMRLQWRMLSPADAQRDRVFAEVAVEATAAPATYTLQLLTSGKFQLVQWGREGAPREVAVGERVELEDASFVLAEEALRHPRMSFTIRTLQETVDQITHRLAVVQAAREARIVTVGFRSADRQLAWQVPNAVVERFMALRAQSRKTEARSTAEFLKGQLDTITGQLARAEEELRRYRERYRVIDPEAEASSQVGRLVSMQSERSTIEAERAALERLLQEVDAQAARTRAGDPSPYRQLLAFPTLLRSATAADLLRSLAEIERERNTLLARRTEQDPDVRQLTDRVHEIEAQLRTTGSAYLQGLTNQVNTLDSELAQFRGELSAIPRRELDVARLERKPEVLSEMSKLLQTRLKEAEIARAVDDASVQVVDSALPPRKPVSPRPELNMFGSLLAGLLVGLVLALLLEFRDRAVRTRADVETLTGLQVIGFIPRIARRGRQMALIAERAIRRTESALPRPPAAAPAKPAAPATENGGGRRGYTFLPLPEEERPAAGAAGAAEGGGASLAPEPAAPFTPGAWFTISESGRIAAEALGVLQTNIAFARVDQSIKTVVLTSALPGEGKTTDAVNFALALAQRGLRVLLMDADMRRGCIHTAFQANQAPGLSEVLAGVVSLGGAMRSVSVGERGELHFLPKGHPPSNAPSLLGSEMMGSLLNYLRENYDSVIIDSPPVNVVTDAALLGSHADGVLLVARAGVTESAALAYAVEQLERVRAPILGVVLNDIDFRKDSAYDRAYQYYNYDGYVGTAADD